jgi:hypothetical protein
MARSETIALAHHTAGHMHAVPRGAIFPVPKGVSFADWLRAVHTSNHDAPYAPAVPHDLDDRTCDCPEDRP